jgi:mRNA interferase MazF
MKFGRVIVKIKRGNIVTVSFPYTEDPKRSKSRPALIVQNDVGNEYSNNTIIIMITSSVSRRLYPVQALVPANKKTGLDKDSVADAGVIFTVSKDRIKEVIGKCSVEIISNVDKALSVSLGCSI